MDNATNRKEKHDAKQASKTDRETPTATHEAGLEGSLISRPTASNQRRGVRKYATLLGKLSTYGFGAGQLAVTG